MRCSDLIGKEVLDAEAKSVGYVRDIDFEVDKWNVISIVVKTGFIKKVLIPVSTIDKIGDRVILKISADKIQKK
jgi:sporulation protein YlmC with PRC-barrel domain